MGRMSVPTLVLFHEAMEALEDAHEMLITAHRRRVAAQLRAGFTPKDVEELLTVIDHMERECAHQRVELWEAL